MLAALVLAAAGCGYEAVPPDELDAAAEATKSVGTARSASVTRYTVDGNVQEFRMHERIDYAGERSEWVMAATGCRTIAIGDVSYVEMPHGELPGGKRWIRYGVPGEFAEEVFEKSIEPSEQSGAAGLPRLPPRRVGRA